MKSGKQNSSAQRNQGELEEGREKRREKGWRGGGGERIEGKRGERELVL